MLKTTELLRDSILVLTAKREMLRREIGNINTLVIGSSHGDYGFNPRFCPHSFNMCCRSQDLKYSYHLYEKLSQRHPQIENIVLFYSTFSPGHFLENFTDENDICVALNEVFQLDLAYKDTKLKKLAQSIKGKLNDLSLEIKTVPGTLATAIPTLPGYSGFLPMTAKAFSNPADGVEKRAKGHLKYNNRSESHAYLPKILSLAHANNHKVFIVIPPVTSQYRKALGIEKSVLFQKLFETLYDDSMECYVNIIDCFDSPLFVDSYFGDFDHLHPLGDGAQILSTLISDTIQASTSQE